MTEFTHCVTWLGSPVARLAGGKATTAHKKLATSEEHARTIAKELTTDKNNCNIIVWSLVEVFRWDIDYTTESDIQEDIFC